jgi:hypothetical protein
MVPAVAVTCVSPNEFVEDGEVTVAVAPLEGGVNVTVIPDTGFEYLSRTLTRRASPNAVFTVAL